MRKVAREDQSGEDMSVPEADPKVTKEEFAYVWDKEPRRCGTCNMYYHNKKGEGRCTMVEGDISGADGVCTFWAKRRTQPKSDKEYKPMMDKKTAGYIEVEGGTLCGTCKFFKPDSRECKMVEGDIDPLGCCIAWMPNEDTEDQMISAENYKKIFKFYGEVDLS